MKMGFTIIKWLVGLAVIAGGSTYIYSKVTGKKIFAKDACILDLPDDLKNKITQAIESKNIPALTAYADAAEEDGFDCASDEIRAKILLVQDELDKSVAKCPTKSELEIALADIVSKKLSKEKSLALALNLRKNGCTADAAIIEQKIIDVYPTSVAEIEISKKSDSIITTPTPDKINKFIAIVLSKAPVKSSNELRAEADWPALMSTKEKIESDIKGKVEAVALCLKKTSAIYLLAGEGPDGYTSNSFVNLGSAIPGCAPDPVKIKEYIKRLSEYGTLYKDAISELDLIHRSLINGKFSNE
jgi:hypothetical protein